MDSGRHTTQPFVDVVGNSRSRERESRRGIHLRIEHGRHEFFAMGGNLTTTLAVQATLQLFQAILKFQNLSR